MTEGSFLDDVSRLLKLKPLRRKPKNPGLQAIVGDDGIALPFGLSVGPETPRPMSGEPIQMVDARSEIAASGDFRHISFRTRTGCVYSSCTSQPASSKRADMSEAIVCECKLEDDPNLPGSVTSGSESARSVTRSVTH